MKEFIIGRFGIELTKRYFLVFDYKKGVYRFEIGFSDYAPGNFVLTFNEKRII